MFLETGTLVNHFQSSLRGNDLCRWLAEWTSLSVTAASHQSKVRCPNLKVKVSLKCGEIH